MSLRAGLTGLMAIWIALALSLPSPASKGLRVDIAVPSAGRPCGDGDRLLFAFVLPDGRVRLNEDEVKKGDLDSRLEEIFRRRPESIVFVVPDPLATFSQVTELVDVAQARVKHVALVTRKVLQNPGNCGPVIPVPPQPPAPKPILKPVPLWPW